MYICFQINSIRRKFRQNWNIVYTLMMRKWYLAWCLAKDIVKNWNSVIATTWHSFISPPEQIGTKNLCNAASGAPARHPKGQEQRAEPQQTPSGGGGGGVRGRKDDQGWPGHEESLPELFCHWREDIGEVRLIRHGNYIDRRTGTAKLRTEDKMAFFPINPRLAEKG